MNKSEFIKTLASVNGLKISEAKKIVELVLDSVTSVMAMGEKLALPGFGTFIPRPSPRAGITEGRRPGRTVSFKPSGAMKFIVTKGWARRHDLGLD